VATVHVAAACFVQRRLLMPSTRTSQLASLIPGEIRDDELYAVIHHLARTLPLRHILEIGSSSGRGSTEAFVRGLRENGSPATLHCMEVSRERCAALAEHYASDPFVRAHNVSSVPVESFPSEDDVAAFYCLVPSPLNRYPLSQILGWLRQDIAYVRDSGVPTDGIERVRRENRIGRFDLVLIDGSEFTGSAELDLVRGASWIVLDDVRTYKCHHAYRRLRADPAYRLVHENLELRHGYAVFGRAGPAGKRA
jgi:hypothetical protein